MYAFLDLPLIPWPEKYRSFIVNLKANEPSFLERLSLQLENWFLRVCCLVCLFVLNKGMESLTGERLTCAFNWHCLTASWSFPYLFSWECPPANPSLLLEFYLESNLRHVLVNETIGSGLLWMPLIKKLKCAMLHFDTS